MSKEFKSAFERVKAYLGKSLTADNTDEITGLSNDLETMNQEMEKEESEHAKTKNKLVDFVRNTTFKADPSTPADPIDDTPKSIDEASDLALKQILKNRKENKTNES